MLDGKTDTLLAIVPVGLSPAALSFDSVRDYVYCLNPNDDSVTVIDAAFNTVACRVAVGDNPIALAWAPAVNRLYVTNHDGSSISVINTTPTGIAEQPLVSAVREPPLVIRGNLLVTGSDRALLFNATGRVVQGLHAGANDVHRLPAGVYFLYEPARATARKILLLR